LESVRDALERDGEVEETEDEGEDEDVEQDIVVFDEIAEIEKKRTGKPRGGPSEVRMTFF
jgi:hypothetical protein